MAGAVEASGWGLRLPWTRKLMILQIENHRNWWHGASFAAQVGVFEHAYTSSTRTGVQYVSNLFNVVNWNNVAGYASARSYSG